MLALQSAPLHLRDQDKQERRFDQPLLFTSFLKASNPSTSSSARHHNHHHHPRHHSYHHPTPPSVSAVAAAAVAAAAACAVPNLMPHSHHQQQPQSHHLAKHQTLFYRECDLKQDLSIANAKAHHHHPYHINYNSNTTSTSSNGIHKNVAASNHLAPLSGTTWTPRAQNDDTAASASAALTPIHKIEARIAQMTIEDCAKEKIVLLLTGSFCPIHLHHTEMLEAAKARMEQEDLDQGIAPSTSTSNNSSGAAMILGGFLSPSHDLYVGEKLKGEDLVLNSRERLDLCRLQTADSDWIDVDAWEASQDRFYDYNKVTSRLQQFLQERCQTALQNRMNALLSKQQSPVVGGGSGEQLDEKSYASMVPQRSGSLTHSLTNNNNSTVNNLSQSAAGRNPYNIRVVYLCGADFVLRTGARKLVGGIVVVDRPLGAPSSSNQRRSILLTQSGGSISVPVSNQIEDPSSSTSGASASNSTTTGETAKQRVFKRLEQSYGSEWCEASRNNIWWLPARSRTESEDISSTRIRGLLSDRKSCKGLLHPAVAQRLLEKKARQDAGL